MWKNFLYFQKGQRIAIIALIILIVIAIVINWILPKIIPQKDVFDPSFSEKAALFKDSLQSLDSIRQLEWQQQYEERYKKSGKLWDKKSKDDYTLFKFDPNKLDSAGFIRLGLKPWMISNIIKYRNKGGKYKEKADFEKVYGLSSEKYAELAPYIAISVEPKVETVKESPVQVQQKIVELNSADTTELMEIKGIGQSYARGIVRFRNQTGGFVSVSQLNEIYGMRPENYERIAPFCSVDLSLVKKIKINTATVDKLRSHPYIDFYQAKYIYELRRKKGKLKSLNELKGAENFTEEWFEKTKPYLSFE